MPTYNFTVRASDDTGAYADRDFSINVRNTIVERYVTLNATTAYSSHDTTNWTTRTSAVSGMNWLVNGNGIWIAAKCNPAVSTGGSSTYYYSPDAINWYSGTFPGIVNYVQYLNGVFYAFPISTSPYFQWNLTTIYTSSDGITWNTKTVTTNLGTGLYFFPTSLLMSGDGKMWIFGAVSTIQTVNKFGYLSGSANAIFCLSSSDSGSTWVKTTNTTVTAVISSAIYVNGLFIACDYINKRIITSIDGNNWTPRTVSSTFGSYGAPTTLTYGNGMILLSRRCTGGGDSTTSTSISTYNYSVNGINWSESSLSSTIKPTANISSYCNNIFSGGKFITTNTYTTDICVSKNGTSWTSITGPAISTILASINNG